MGVLQWRDRPHFVAKVEGEFDCWYVVRKIYDIKDLSSSEHISNRIEVSISEEALLLHLIIEISGFENSSIGISEIPYQEMTVVIFLQTAHPIQIFLSIIMTYRDGCRKIE